MNSVAHLTSVHPRYDTRIFLKMCTSLAKDPKYKVYLVVADDLPDEIKNGVRIVSVGKNKGGRFSRMTKTVREVYQKAIELDCDLYHLHDPELLPVGLKLKRLGKKVVYDVHEDNYENIKLKKWLPAIARSATAYVFHKYESAASRKLDKIVTATQKIEQKFTASGCRAKWISNYPLMKEFCSAHDGQDISNIDDKVCFVGGISEIRAIREMVPAAYLAAVKLILAGEFESKALYDEMRLKPEWTVVEEKGYVDRKGVANIFSESIAGLILYHSHPTAPFSQPNKLFEYMAAGLPVIASNYPLWESIVSGNKCGICVNPFDIKEIADAIIYLKNHPEERKQMGLNGRNAVEEKYNWETEEKKLFKIYREIL